MLYLSAEQFMYRFVQALNLKICMDLKIFRSVDILMVDDVQFIAGKVLKMRFFIHLMHLLNRWN